MAIILKLVIGALLVEDSAPAMSFADIMTLLGRAEI